MCGRQKCHMSDHWNWSPPVPKNSVTNFRIHCLMILQSLETSLDLLFPQFKTKAFFLSVSLRTKHLLKKWKCFLDLELKILLYYLQGIHKSAYWWLVQHLFLWDLDTLMSFLCKTAKIYFFAHSVSYLYPSQSLISRLSNRPAGLINLQSSLLLG